MTVPGADLETVFRKYNDFVYRICFRYCRDAKDAEDLAQEVFLKLHRRLPEFRGDSAMTTWIFRIAANCCIDAIRARREHTRFEDCAPDGPDALRVSGHGDAALARIDLDRILAHTDPRTREILFLCLAEGCSHQEAGEITGLSKWAITKIVLRFQGKFRIRKKAWFAELFQAGRNAGPAGPGNAGRMEREAA